MLFVQDVIHKSSFSSSQISCFPVLRPGYEEAQKCLPVTIVIGTLTGFDSSSLSFCIASTSTSIGGVSTSSKSMMWSLKVGRMFSRKFVYYSEGRYGKSQPRVYCTPGPKFSAGG